MSLRVAIVSADTFEFEARPLRMARALAADGHSVHVLALPGDGLPTEEELDHRIRVTRLEVDRRITSALRPLPASARTVLARAIGLDPRWSILPATDAHGLDRLRYPVRRILELVAHVRRVGPWAEAVVAAAPETDVFQTEALIALPVVREAAQRVGGQYVYDVADYQTEGARVARLPRPVRETLARMERRWARESAGLMAVSEPVASLVAAHFGIPRPGVVMNCPPAWRLDETRPPTSTRLRDVLNLSQRRPIVLHHGQFKLDRGIEELVQAADHPALRQFDPAIVFMGYGRLQPFLAAAAAQRPDRVFVLPAVPPDQVVDWVAGADVAYLGCPPRTLNLQLTLPNKVFECLMAGVPVVAADGTEQARLVAQESVGRCTTIESVDALAADLAAILAMPEGERHALRQHCRNLGLNKYSWERHAGPLIDLYRRLDKGLKAQPVA